jgi:hypothetical protein
MADSFKQQPQQQQQPLFYDSYSFEEMIRKETTDYLERAWEAYRRLVRRAAGVELVPVLEAEKPKEVAYSRNDETNAPPEAVQ